jgi:hypothetical protein
LFFLFVCGESNNSMVFNKYGGVGGSYGSSGGGFGGG